MRRWVCVLAAWNDGKWDNKQQQFILICIMLASYHENATFCEGTTVVFDMRKGRCFEICELHQQVHSKQKSQITVVPRQILGWRLQQANTLNSYCHELSTKAIKKI